MKKKKKARHEDDSMLRGSDIRLQGSNAATSECKEIGTRNEKQRSEEREKGETEKALINIKKTDTQTGTEAMHFSRSPLMALAVTAIIGVLLFGPSMSLIFSVAC